MERFCLIISVPVLSSNNVCVSIFLCFPRGLVEQLRVCLESTCNSAISIGGLQGIVELDLLHWHLGVSVGLRSVVGLQIGLSESGAPFFVQSRVRGQLSSGSVASEETRTGFVECLLISHETKQIESLIQTYSWLLNLSLVFWKSSSFTKHLLEILV